MFIHARGVTFCGDLKKKYPFKLLLPLWCKNKKKLTKANLPFNKVPCRSNKFSQHLDSFTHIHVKFLLLLLLPHQYSFSLSLYEIFFTDDARSTDIWQPRSIALNIALHGNNTINKQSPRSPINNIK